MWPWKTKHEAQPAPEAVRALEQGKAQLVRVRELRVQAGQVQVAASESLRDNHFGLAITAAMGGRTDR